MICICIKHLCVLRQQEPPERPLIGLWLTRTPRGTVCLHSVMSQIEITSAFWETSCSLVQQRQGGFMFHNPTCQFIVIHIMSHQHIAIKERQYYSTGNYHRYAYLTIHRDYTYYYSSAHRDSMRVLLRVLNLGNPCYRHK